MFEMAKYKKIIEPYGHTGYIWQAFSLYQGANGRCHPHPSPQLIL